jgi:hypothetical protein
MNGSPRILFVSNGHGEIAIASRIAAELRRIGLARTEHFALVGAGRPSAEFPPVGPQRSLPSGGLVAMGNAIALARDVAAGFVPLWLGQRRFLTRFGCRYAAVVAVGDVYCLGMSLAARRPTVFVGTAKSAYVAPYGRFECSVMRRARRVFVRDAATAACARARGVEAEAVGNVIADLAQSSERFAWEGRMRIVVLPGSRSNAYANAARIGAVLGLVARLRAIEIAVSIAPGIDGSRILAALGVCARAWEGDLGALFADATLAVGQAGTANEAAAAAGVPVVVLADSHRKEGWYRMRQRKLLDGALVVVFGDSEHAAGEIVALLDDESRRAAMGRIGRERLGEPGGAAAIASAVAALAREGRA